ncbi:hypothetical protein F4859DRAFT_459447 [Xylaria cf. heliscus]|nr:hypothetical protein F4859DRAFT_459447 [Xylaria cf. heliscus]
MMFANFNMSIRRAWSSSKFMALSLILRTCLLQALLPKVPANTDGILAPPPSTRITLIPTWTSIVPILYSHCPVTEFCPDQGRKVGHGPFREKAHRSDPPK